MQKELHNTSKIENQLGIFYLEVVRLGNLGGLLNEKGQLDYTRDCGGKIKTTRK